MTDGIIQQVCHNYNGIIQDYLLDQLQQELIEKIKQEVKLHPRWPSIHIDILIGDNQE